VTAPVSGRRVGRPRLNDVLLGGIAALLAFALVPAVLVVMIGLPLPAHLTRADVVSLHGLYDLLAISAWVAWAACCYTLLQSVVAKVRRGETGAAAGARFGERLAAQIAAAILVISAMTVSVSSAAGATGHGRAPASRAAVTAPPPAVSPRAILAARMTAAGTVATTAGPPATPSAPTVPAPAVTAPTAGVAPAVPGTSAYTVRPGDSLWTIAVAAYGDGNDWPAIARANLGRVMAGGTRFVDPSMILPGWVLALPDLDPPAPAPAPATTTSPPDPGAAEPVAVALSDTAATIAEAAPRQDGTLDPARPVGSTGTAGTRRPAGKRTPAQVTLPELAALGFGVVVAAILARRLRRARRLEAEARPDGAPPDPPPEVASRSMDAATLAQRFDGAPVLDMIEAANAHLAASLYALEIDRPIPAVRAVRAGPFGVELVLATPCGWAPNGWELGDDHDTWLWRPGFDPGWRTEGAPEVWLPVLLPVGDDDRGAWLIPLEPGMCLPVLGPAARDLIAAMHLSVRGWWWAEQVVITRDPGEAARFARLSGADGAGSPLARVVFIGDPRQIPDGLRGRVAVITTEPVAGTHLTVVVDERAATLHPIGAPVRPHLLDAAVAGDLEALAGCSDPAGAAAPRERSNGRGPRADEPESAVGPEDPLAPPAVEVRLLSPTPRLEGLAEPLPPKLARRATELVAYLAVHRADTVTGDRLRARVLGSSDADAASKTLFNVVAAARRSLGAAPDGAAFLPTATRAGRYRVAPDLGVDTERAAALVAAARLAEGAADPDDDGDASETAMALYRAALELVEGEPLVAVASGYGWWEAEGHARAVGAVLVDAAGALARLAGAAGHHDLGDWAIAKGRLVDPYSEALTRAALRAAAAAGDPDRIRREWEDCCRRADELVPGSLPTPATEDLYASLTRPVRPHPKELHRPRRAPLANR
jgi:hypothetical protein